MHHYFASFPKPSKGMRLILFIFALFGASNFCFGIDPPLPKTRVNVVQNVYEKDILAQARREGKLVLIDFWASYCVNCMIVEQYGFNDERFGEFADENCIVYKVDIQRFLFDEDVVKAKYNVGTLPTFVVLNSMGKVIDRFEGQMSGTGFLTRLRPLCTPNNLLKAPPLPVVSTPTEVLAAAKTPINAVPKRTLPPPNNKVNTTNTASKISADMTKKTIAVANISAPSDPYDTDAPSNMATAPKQKIMVAKPSEQTQIASTPHSLPPNPPKGSSAAMNAVAKIRAVSHPPGTQKEIAQTEKPPKPTALPPKTQGIAAVETETAPFGRQIAPASLPTKEAARPVARLPKKSAEFETPIAPNRAPMTVNNKTLADGYYEVDIKQITPKGYAYQVGTYSQLAFAAKEIERIENVMSDQKVFLWVVTLPNKTEPVFKVMVGDFSTATGNEKVKNALFTLNNQQPILKNLR